MFKEEAKFRMKERAPVYVQDGNYMKIVMSESAIVECFIYEFLDYIPESADRSMTLIPDDEVWKLTFSSQDSRSWTPKAQRRPMSTSATTWRR